MQVLSYGGGTNSAAILAGLLERGERPDLIVFADTGSEWPHTYAHIKEVSEWCAKVGFPGITVIKGGQPQMIKDGSLGAECLRLGVLPSKAYGMGGCSLKWKVEPQRKFLRTLVDDQGIKPADIVQLIGFDADEPERYERAVQLADRNPFAQRFPLIEWEWGRAECVEAIERAGLSQPGKSSCYFCPSSKKHEILELRRRHPVLFGQAIEMERRALAGEGQAPAARMKGLGRGFSWREFVEGADAVKSGVYLSLDDFKLGQTALFSDAGTPEVDCGCYSG
jgi:hypothetical protein